MPKGGAPQYGSVREEATRLLGEINKKKIPLQPDDKSVLAASIVPDWSKGTSPIDEETGAPVVATEPTVDAMPEAGAEQIPTTEGLSTDDKEVVTRDDKGRFVASKEDVDQSGEQPAAEQRSDAVAEVEAVAARELEKPDPFLDYEEVEYEDPDLDRRVKVLAPKSDANLVKRGYSRQADYTRKTMALAAFRKDLQPLIEDGRMQQVLPLIRMALEDPEYGNFVVEAARRRSMGLPLNRAEEQAAQVANVVQAATAPPPQVAPLTEAEDPFMAQYLAPVKTQIQEVAELARGIAADQQRERAAAQQAEQQRQQQQQLLQQSHAALTQAFPDEFNGDIGHDDASFRKALDYAYRSGYVQAYGYHPMTYVAAWNQFRQERAAAAASPAAEAVKVKQQQAAVRAAAATVPTGAPATQVVKKSVPAAPPTRRDGQPVPAGEYLQQAAARLAALRQQQ